MELICQKYDLMNALSTVSRALSARTTNPMYETIRLEASGASLQLLATDQNLAIESTIIANVSQGGSVLLSGRLFPELIRKLPEGEVRLTVNEKLSAVIRAGDSKTTLQGISAESYPPLPQVENIRRVLLPQQELREMIRQTAYAASKDEYRPILTGCLLEVEDGRASMVATDGFRLSVKRGKTADPSENVECVVSSRYWNEIGRSLGEEDVNLTLEIGTKNMRIDLGDTRIVVTLLEGTYMKYRALLPNQFQTSIRVDRGMLLDCIDRASLIAKEGKNNLLRFQIDPQHLTITSNSELGDVFEQLDIQHQGQELSISFNINYIAEALKALSDDEVVFRFNTDITPCVIAPVEGDEYITLVLPVRTY